MVEAKVEMGSGLIKAGDEGQERWGKWMEGGEVKKCWKYNIAGRVAFRGSGESRGIKTKAKLKMSQQENWRDMWEGEEAQNGVFSDDLWLQIIYD